jgi:hypothetical protein
MKNYYTLFTHTTFLTLVLFIGYSCNNSEKIVDQFSKKKEVPTTMKPAEAPKMDEIQMVSLKKFNPSSCGSEMKYRSTDEVFGILSDRSYAYNECNNAKITYFLYGGNSEEHKSGRWFCRKILKWDVPSRAWKTFFDDGIQYYSNLSDDVALQKGSWYYTLQWVWDPAAKSWIKFNANLLVQI